MTRSPPPSTDASELARRVRGGTRWALSAHVASQLTSLVVFGVLCRWISPADWGVFNTALLVVTLPRMMVQVGLSAATIQRERHAPGELSSLFWINALFGLFCAAFAVGGGWWLGILSHSERLFGVTLSLAGTALVAAFGSQHLALLERELKIGRSASLRWIAQAVSGGVAIVLAVRGAGILALVTQQYVELGLLAILAWIAEPWRPGRWSGLSGLRSSLRFSRHVAFTNLVFYVAQNLDKLLLYVMVGGTVTGEAAVGMYGLAYNFMMKPVYLVSTPVSSVMLPALSRAVARHDTFRELVTHFYRLSAAILFPSALGLLVVADEVMRVLAGEQWHEAGRLLALFAPAVLVHGLFNITGSLLMSTGRTAWLLRVALVLALIQFQGYVAGFWLGGLAAPTPWGPVYGVATSYSAVLLLVLFVPYQTVALREVGLSFAFLVRRLIPTLMSASCMGLVVWSVRRLLQSHPLWADAPTVVRLLTLVMAGVLTYVLLARRELRLLLQA